MKEGGGAEIDPEIAPEIAPEIDPEMAPEIAPEVAPAKVRVRAGGVDEGLAVKGEEGERGDLHNGDIAEI